MVDEVAHGERLASGLSDTYNTAIRHQRRYYRLEITCWIVAGILISLNTIVGGVILFFQNKDFTFTENLAFIAGVLIANLSNLIASSIVIAFPFFFRRIFNELPFFVIRRRIEAFRVSNQLAGLRVDAAGETVQIGSITLTDPATVTDTIRSQLSLETIKRLDPRELLAFYAERSSELTMRIYARAGVYLLVGVMIAFIGLFVFYLRSKDLPKTSDPIEHALLLFPGFGVLFFIEFVALFFLRLYRSAMDEFRYFEAVRRNREENLVVLKMFREYMTIVPTKEVIQAMNIYSTAGKLMKDETTEILETRKLQTDELALVEKFIEVISSVRQPGKGEAQGNKKQA